MEKEIAFYTETEINGVLDERVDTYENELVSTRTPEHILIAIEIKEILEKEFEIKHFDEYCRLCNLQGYSIKELNDLTYKIVGFDRYNGYLKAYKKNGGVHEYPYDWDNDTIKTYLQFKEDFEKIDKKKVIEIRNAVKLLDRFTSYCDTFFHEDWAEAQKIADEQSEEWKNEREERRFNTWCKCKADFAEYQKNLKCDDNYFYREYAKKWAKERNLVKFLGAYII